MSDRFVGRPLHGWPRRPYLYRGTSYHVADADPPSRRPVGFRAPDAQDGPPAAPPERRPMGFRFERGGD